MLNALIIMAKMPVAGEVKTRLQPFLNSDQCSALSAALIHEAALKTKRLETEVFFAVSPEESISSFDKFLNDDQGVFPQSAGDLGERMNAAFGEVFKMGFEQVVMIGTDCPLMDMGIVRQAFLNLESGSDAVLGPTEDGGYYLIGLKKLTEGIFENIDWSTERVLTQTRERFAALNMDLELLALLYDVDRKEDLIRLAEELEEDSIRAPIVAEWLVKHSYLFKSSL